ncbi:MAG: FAD-dependent oxidoreductase [Bacteroidales bacterium]|nr:FAD-dependent oxidoreductase [Bacteroidales bacterium]
MKHAAILLLGLLALTSCRNQKDYDVCVYGSTPAGVTAARAAALKGMRVLLVSPESHVGGIVSGGLGYTDIGNKQAIEGLSKEFYRRIGKHYGRLEQYTYEPHVAEQVFEEMLRVRGLGQLRGYELLDLERDGKQIRSIRIAALAPRADTLTIQAERFIDCSYCGDLLARSGVSYIVGREGIDAYDEPFAGIQVGPRMMQFPDGIDPYVIKGDASSGLLPGIEAGDPGPFGVADDKTQAYCYRCFLTQDEANRIPFSRPAHYDSTYYTLAARILERFPDWSLKNLFIMRGMPCGKTEFNNRGGFSTDAVGLNTDYPEADRARREQIEQAHRDYTEGLFWFYSSDPRVPQSIREEMSTWGWCKDEFGDCGNFPRQLYIREARRMVGAYVQTMHDALLRTQRSDIIAYGSYGLDSHSVRRVVVRDEEGHPIVKNEGSLNVHVERPYPISYGCLVPKAQECENLLVPVCLSSSHIAYSSLRVEPCFMVLGQVAGLAAAFSLDAGIPVQEVPAAQIRAAIEANPFLDGTAPDIILDDPEAISHSGWTQVYTRTSYGPSCLQHEGDPAAGELCFALPDTLSGHYELWSYEQKFSDRNGVSSALPQNLSQRKRFCVLDGDRSVLEADFDGEGFEVLGQTAGDWWRVGSLRLQKGRSLRVRVQAGSEDPVRCDALMLIKKR